MTEWPVECPSCLGAGEHIAWRCVSRWSDPADAEVAIKCETCDGTGKALVKTHRMSKADFDALYMQVPVP